MLIFNPSSGAGISAIEQKCYEFLFTAKPQKSFVAFYLEKVEFLLVYKSLSGLFYPLSVSLGFVAGTLSKV